MQLGSSRCLASGKNENSTAETGDGEAENGDFSTQKNAFAVGGGSLQRKHDAIWECLFIISISMIRHTLLP